MRREDDVGGRARVTRTCDTGIWRVRNWFIIIIIIIRASAARRLNRDEVVEIWRLVGCEDFVSE